MSAKCVGQAGALVLLAVCAIGAGASDKSDYERRAAARDLALFHSLDRNADGTVTRLEAQLSINFLGRFDDMDIDRDDVVTTAELQRYLKQKYGVHPNRGRP